MYSPRFLTLFTILLVGLFATDAFAIVHVKGYVTKNGTYVAPYYRSSPNGTKLDNWSTKGNINPFTGKVGTKNPDYESSVGPSVAVPSTYQPSYVPYVPPSYVAPPDTDVSISSLMGKLTNPQPPSVPTIATPSVQFKALSFWNKDDGVHVRAFVDGVKQVLLRKDSPTVVFRSQGSSLSPVFLTMTSYQKFTCGRGLHTTADAFESFCKFPTVPKDSWGDNSFSIPISPAWAPGIYTFKLNFENTSIATQTFEVEVL